MIYHYCILESTPEIFAAWLHRTVTGGRFHFDESPAVMILTFLPEVTWRDDNGLMLTMGGVRLDIETGESTPLEVASFAVSALSVSRVVVHMAFGDFTSGLVAYFSSVLKVIGELWPESGLAPVDESTTPDGESDEIAARRKKLKRLWDGRKPKTTVGVFKRFAAEELSVSMSTIRDDLAFLRLNGQIE